MIWKHEEVRLWLESWSLPTVLSNKVWPHGPISSISSSSLSGCWNSRNGVLKHDKHIQTWLAGKCPQIINGGFPLPCSSTGWLAWKKARIRNNSAFRELLIGQRIQDHSRSFLASESFQDTVPHVFSATYLATNTIQNIQNTVLIPEFVTCVRFFLDTSKHSKHFTFFFDTSIPGWLGDQHPFGTWKCRTWEGNLRVSVALNKAPVTPVLRGVAASPKTFKIILKYFK